MIQQALQAITDELNAYLKRVFDVNDSQNRAVLSFLTSPTGEQLPDTLNKLCLTLVNLEQEPALRNGAVGRLAAGDNGRTHVQFNPPIRLNLRVVLAANFIDYGESLKFLAAGIACLHKKNVLTPQNSPTLDKRLDRLMVEMETTTTHEWNNLWNMLGSKYRPSVVYKVRMLTIQDEPAGQPLPVIGAVGQQTTS